MLSPSEFIQRQAQRIDDLEKRLFINFKYFLNQKKQRLISLSKTLDALSPLKTLDRGYALVRLKGSQQVISTQKSVKKDDILDIQLKEGQIEAKVL